MKALIVGANGQVGKSLLQTAPKDVSVEARTRAQLDLENGKALRETIAAMRPFAVINAAAYTAVDRAETERERAYAINAGAVGKLGEICAGTGARLVHISTDYVFDGHSSAAYDTNAQTHPINVYGASKLEGERLISATPNLDWAVVRTAWVYAPWGRNFLLTMLRLMRERTEVSVVGDQIGSPTSALTLARFLWQVALTSEPRGIFHYTDAGVASWYDFAVAIGEEALAAGLLTRPAAVKPIVTSEYPTPAKRPSFSLLSSESSLRRVPAERIHWRAALREVIEAARNHRP